MRDSSNGVFGITAPCGQEQLAVTLGCDTPLSRQSHDAAASVEIEDKARLEGNKSGESEPSAGDGKCMPPRFTTTISINTGQGSDEDIDSLAHRLDSASLNSPGVARPAGQCPIYGESVITQVNSRSEVQTIERPTSVPGSDRPGGMLVHHGGSGWKRKVRNLLCCLAPGDGFFGASGDPGLHFPFRTGKHAFAGEFLLPPILEKDRGKKTLVLDLDETLVHSCFKPVPNADYIIPVDIDGQIIDVYVVKRPWCDHFMAAVAPHFEVVVFTASLGKYANPLLDLMDPEKLVRHRLFRESCVLYQGNYVKDLDVMGRPLSDMILVDNSPHSYSLQLSNAVPIGTFIDQMDDRELLDLIPMLMDTTKVKDVRSFLPKLTGVGTVLEVGDG